MFHQTSGWFLVLIDNNTNAPPRETPILTENSIEITTETGDVLLTEL